MTNEELLEQQKKAGEVNLAQATEKDTTGAALEPESGTVTQTQNYLQSLLSNKPANFNSQYTQQLESLYDKVMNRDKFSYDVAGDPLYQQYKNQYAQMGELAMQDTIGNAAALTGGYGNSWAATAGNQAYQAYLQRLTDKVPELYESAFGRYTQEGQDLQNQLALTADLYENDYQKYMDDLGYMQQMQQTAYNQVMSMISAGMTPPDELIAAAGLTKDALGLNNRGGGGGDITAKKFDEAELARTYAAIGNPLEDFAKTPAMLATDKFGRPTTTVITEEDGNGGLKHVDTVYNAGGSLGKTAPTTIVKTNANSPTMPTVVATSPAKQNTQTATTSAKENAMNSIIKEYERLLKSNSQK